jgi:hypothetical protein
MKGRPMSDYIVVPNAWRSNPKKVGEWVARSLAWSSGLPAKAPKKSKS